MFHFSTTFFREGDYLISVILIGHHTSNYSPVTGCYAAGPYASHNAQKPGGA